MNKNGVDKVYAKSLTSQVNILAVLNLLFSTLDPSSSLVSALFNGVVLVFIETKLRMPSKRLVKTVISIYLVSGLCLHIGEPALISQLKGCSNWEDHEKCLVIITVILLTIAWLELEKFGRGKNTVQLLSLFALLS